MRRNLKALGLALLAAFAMSAVVASAAQAEAPAEFTAAEYPAVLTGHEEEEKAEFFEFTPGNKTECSDVTYEATLTEASTEVTVTPHYTGCTASGVGTNFNLNGCHYKFTAGTATSSTVAHGAVHVICPPNKQIEVVVGGGLCVVDIGPQTLAAGITYTNIKGGGPGTKTPHDYVTVDIDITGKLKYTDTDTGGIFCPFAGNHTTENGSIVSTVILKGYKDLKEDHTKPGTPEAKEYTHGETEIAVNVRSTP